MSDRATPATANSVSDAPRWAVRAAHATALVVLPSGLWRITMVLGHSAGYTDEGFVSLETPGAKLWMLALSVVTELLALLTIGLVRPWGTVLPGWIPLFGGRAPRPMAVVVPAALGALVLTLLWTPFLWWWSFPHSDLTGTGYLVVGLIYQPLVLWGPLLAAVTVSYYRRHVAHGRAASYAP
ncbi:hypothetical protein [Streptomyces sp. A5-4]|uniref:hypothetical protein n=1 Tax=Streptomyces sp. A5-4 TaxID=3384771 RepID=UPI003DA8182A